MSKLLVRPLTEFETRDLLHMKRREFEGKYHIGYRTWKQLRAKHRLPAFEDCDTFEKLFEAVATHAEVQREDEPTDTFHAEHWGDEPVGLLFSSDWHVGSQWCDYRQLRADMEQIGQFRRDYPRALHLAHLGDLWDGYLVTNTKSAGGLYEETETRIDRQQKLALGLANLAGDWDVMLYGCHPSWTLTTAGQDTVSPIARVLGAVSGGYGVEYEAVVGEQTYRVVMRHKAKGESSISTTNAQRTMDNELGPAGARADVIALGHMHYNDLQKRPKAGRPVTYLRAGSYKGGDTFARSIGATMHWDADIGNPLVIFLPDEKRVIPFHGHDWREGLDMLARLRR